MSLAHKHINQKKSYKKDIKEQITNKYFLKKKQALHESPTPEAQRAEGVFQIQSPVYGANFLNNRSITQVRVNERKTNLTRHLKPINN